VSVHRRPRPAAPLPPSELGLTEVTPNDWTPVWARVVASPAVKNVGMWVAWHTTWETGADIHPGNDLLAAESGLTDRHVATVLKQLRDWGFLWRYVEGSRQGRRKIADTYRLTIPDDMAQIPLRPDPHHPNSLHLNSDHLNSRSLSPELSDTITRTQFALPLQDPPTTPANLGLPSADRSVEGIQAASGQDQDLISDEQNAADRVELGRFPPERQEQLLAAAMEQVGADAPSRDLVHAAARLVQAGTP
jgi:hypothetical protein